MDPVSRREVWDIIERAKKGRVVILTTHSMEEADTLADTIGTTPQKSLVKKFYLHSTISNYGEGTATVHRFRNTSQEEVRRCTQDNVAFPLKQNELISTHAGLSNHRGLRSK